MSAGDFCVHGRRVQFTFNLQNVNNMIDGRSCQRVGLRRFFARAARERLINCLGELDVSVARNLNS